MADEKTTHFGFKTVPTEEKAEKVAGVFHSVAAKYDLMNDLMSGGVHRIWKHFTIESSAVRSGQRVLDIAGGTGDLTKQFSRLVGNDGRVVLADINDSMLRVGRDKLCDKGISGNTYYVQADAQSLPFPDTLRSMFRVLKPGGRLLILEFSKPVSPTLESLYDQYSFKLLPKIGQLVVGDAESYAYLAESIRMHPDQETLLNMMTNAGFSQSSYTNMTGGIVALHKGFKVA